VTVLVQRNAPRDDVSGMWKPAIVNCEQSRYRESTCSAPMPIDRAEKDFGSFIFRNAALRNDCGNVEMYFQINAVPPEKLSYLLALCHDNPDLHPPT